MKEEDKKRDILERAKTIIGKIDPALLSVALSEMMIDADEAEEADVAKAKEAIKRIYDSIPEGKDKKSIVSKAITELDSDIIKKEVKIIKESLANIDRKTIMEAAKDYVDIDDIFISAKFCGSSISCTSAISCKASIMCLCALRHPIFSACTFCVNSSIKPQCPCGIRYIVGPYRELEKWEIDPQIREQFKEEIIQEMLQRPELPRAMKKMLKKIESEK
jgi:hypothetical protein